MTPEQKKAKELVDKFLKHSVGSLNTELIEKFNKKHPDFTGSKWKALWDFAKLERSKQCALICVDEIVKTVRRYEYGQGERVDSEDYTYWQEIKKEIENL